MRACTRLYASDARILTPQLPSPPPPPASKPFFSPQILTSEAAVIGRHHQQLSLRVLDDVTPVDGVSVAQELVLVHVNTPVQDLCKGKDTVEIRSTYPPKNA